MPGAFPGVERFVHYERNLRTLHGLDRTSLNGGHRHVRYKAHLEFRLASVGDRRAATADTPFDAGVENAAPRNVHTPVLLT